MFVCETGCFDISPLVRAGRLCPHRTGARWRSDRGQRKRASGREALCSDRCLADVLHGNRGEHLAENDDLVVGGDFVRKALGIVDADVERAVNERLDAAKFLRFADLER